MFRLETAISYNFFTELQKPCLLVILILKNHLHLKEW